MDSITISFRTMNEDTQNKPVPALLMDDFIGENLLKRYEPLRITELTDIPRPDPVISVNGETIASAGNIIIISGASKSGKSAILCYLIAASISENIQDPIPVIHVIFNRSRKAIIHFDTEQSRYSHQRNYKAALRRAGVEFSPDYLLSYNIRSLALDEYQQTTDDICQAASEKFGGIHMILIDGIADYIADTNAKKDSSAIVSYFMRLSNEFNCPVIVIIHTNPTSNPDYSKEQGNLGSECQRKCESLLTIQNKEDVSTLSAKLLRHAGKGDFKPVSLKYDKEKGYHIFCEDEKKKEKSEIRRGELVDIAAKVFGALNSYEYGEALNMIMKAHGCRDRTAKDIFKELNVHGLIVKREDERWMKNPAANY